MAKANDAAKYTLSQTTGSGGLLQSTRNKRRSERRCDSVNGKFNASLIDFTLRAECLSNKRSQYRCAVYRRAPLTAA